jgi:catechol 2,3-dioxygenase
MAIMRLGYVHVRVTDLEAARSHYSDTLGLKVMHEEPGKLMLKGWDEYDHHSVVLEEGGVGLVKFGYKCSKAEDLEQYEKALRAFGVSVERMSKGDNLAVGDGIRFTSPTDHVFELYYDMEFVGTETGALNPEAWPRDVRGVGAPRVDHALITGDDVDAMERLFTECFDWHISERVITDPSDPQLLATWMFAGQTAHDLAVLKGPQGKLHHFAFWLEDWNAVLRAGDLFAMDDVSVDVGPTRHGITRGTTIYFFDPSGNRNEVFSGGYLTNPDFPTITWTADQLGKGVFYIQRELNDRFTSVLT